jgi:uncharacterized protein with FMN-binding domain
MFREIMTAGLIGISVLPSFAASSILSRAERPKWLKAKSNRPDKRRPASSWRNSRVNARSMQTSAGKLLYLVDKYPKSPTRPYYMYQLARHLIDLNEPKAAEAVLKRIKKLPAKTPYKWKYQLTNLAKLKREAAFMQMRAAAKIGKRTAALVIAKRLKPKNGHENLRLAECYILLGEYSKAVPYLEKSHGSGHPDRRFSDEFLRMYAATLARTIGKNNLAVRISEPVLRKGSGAKRYSEWKSAYWILHKLNENIKNDKSGPERPRKVFRNGRFIGACRGFVDTIVVHAYFGKRGFERTNVSKNRETRAWSAITIIPKRITKKRVLAVDAVTGATITSCAIIVAADNAFNNASTWKK